MSKDKPTQKLSRDSPPGRKLYLLHIAVFVSTFDRFAIAPMLVTISIGLGVTLAQATLAASFYYLLYGVMQPVWGLLSDRLGRVRTMRLAFLGAAATGLLSAMAPDLCVLIVARALTGGLFAAIIPASLVYVGDTVAIGIRQKALADVLAAIAVGTALATAGAGLAASLVSWRLAFALPALAAGILAFKIARLPEPANEAANDGPLGQISQVLRRPWAVLVVLIALLEGATIFGFLTFLPPALEAAGYTPIVSGLAVSLYGLGVLGWTRVVKWVSDRVGMPLLISGGGAMLAFGYAAAALDQSLAVICVAAILIGGGYAFMHSTLQTWATEVVPKARAVTISFFAGALFVGSSITTGVAAPLAAGSSFGLLFALAASVSIPLGLLGGVARWRYTKRTCR